MKKAVLMFWGALTVGLTGGCLWGSSYTLPETYDLPVMKAMPVPTPVQFVSFRNLSGADRRFMTRRPDGRIVFDDGRRFLESPELLLERALREAVTGSDRSGAAVKINGVIRRFEFTAPAATAVLGAEFYLTLDQRQLI